MTFPAAEQITLPGRRADGAPVSLEVFRAGQGRPLVLCHGWPEHAYSWRHQIEPLTAAGYEVIVPNQRGYGRSSRPESVPAYDIRELTGDLAALLDCFGHDQAVFVGHDWGAIVVWNMALLQSARVAALANLSVPFMVRGSEDWVNLWERLLGPDFYIVHFNRQPGVADAVFDANTEQFLGNLYRTRQWEAPATPPARGMPLIALAQSSSARGEPLMPAADLAVFVEAFRHSGFTGGINWYRNFSRNWALLADVPQHVPQPALMIYGDHDIVPPLADLETYVPNVVSHSLPCGHWIQQECPDATNRLLLDWLSRHYPAH